MSYQFSPSTRGFYREEVHGGAIPSDAVEVSEARWEELMAGQRVGKRIEPGQDGAPVLADPPPPPAPPPIRRVAPLAFRRRLPTATRQAITLAASAALEAGDAALQTFLDDLSASRVVELDDPDTIAGVAALQAAGLIDAEQAAALLADGTADELP